MAFDADECLASAASASCADRSTALAVTSSSFAAAVAVDAFGVKSASGVDVVWSAASVVVAETKTQASSVVDVVAASVDPTWPAGALCL